ncbi:MAG: hypothetical protein PVF29_14465 [Desulfobacterales bacterium]|jgi:hypothetical protein
MPLNKIVNLQLSDRDLDFLIEAVVPGVADRANLKRILREDKDFRHSFVSDEKVFSRLMADDEILLKISLSLFFEILLCKAASDLFKTSYTLEKKQNMNIPVFDTRDLVGLLNDQLLRVRQFSAKQAQHKIRNNQTQKWFDERNHFSKGGDI